MLYRIKLFFHTIISNRHTLIKTFWFYSLTSLMIFFVLILSSSLKEQIKRSFPNEYYISAVVKTNESTLDITDTLFTPTKITLFNQLHKATLTRIASPEQITIKVGHQTVQVPYELSLTDSFLSINESFAATYNLSLDDVIIIQGRIYRIKQINRDLDQMNPLVLPQDLSLHTTNSSSIRLIGETDLEVIQESLQTFFSTVNAQFIIDQFDIETALLTLVDLIFAILFAVGLLVFLVASFNTRAMTILNITKRQREIVLYYLYGLPERTLFVLYQTEALFVQLLALVVSYGLAAGVIAFFAWLFRLGFHPALVPAIVAMVLQMVWIQRITQKHLKECIEVSIAKI